LAALVLETKPPVTSGSDVTKAGDLQMFESTRDSIRARLVELTVPSVAVGVARDGEILMEEAFGWADREKRIEAGEHTMYSLASISKPITATGLMLLVERGEVDLDRPVNDYLGDAKVKAWVGDTADATVRRVANHTSGLAVHYHFFHEDEEARPPSRDETILRYGHLVRAPGEHYDYANLGYGILDYVISRVSGRSYSDFMREEVFLPLGLTHTSVHVGPGLEGQAAVRYGNDGLPISFYDFDHPGASAVFSSARDLVRFGMFHLKAHRPDQKAILSDEAIDEMQSPTAEINSGMGYGVGWRVAEHDLGYRTVSHAGGMGGVTTLLTLVPSERIAVAVLANGHCPLPRLVTQKVLAELLPPYAARQKEAEAQAAPTAGDSDSAFVPPAEFVGEWVGNVHRYERNVPLTFWFKESGDIHAQLGDQLKTLLNDVTLSQGYLTGKMMGDIGTVDARRRPHSLLVKLKLRGEVLNGNLTALSLPGKRLANALSHWVDLRRRE